MLAAQGLQKMTSQLEPLRFRSRGKGAERTDNPVARTALGSYRFNQQVIGVSLTAERSLGAATTSEDRGVNGLGRRESGIAPDRCR